MTAEIPVLVVGAGPAGLATAITLARYGVASMLVERRPTPVGRPKATALSTRSMELIRSWGLTEPVRAGRVDVIWRRWVGHTLRAHDGEAVPVGLPSPAEAARISPAAPACVPQDHLEPVLLNHLRSLGTAQIHLGTELVNIDEDDSDRHHEQRRGDGVTALLRDRATGVTRQVRARYLVGADGAHSQVRTLLGIPMSGAGHLGDFISVEFQAPLWRLLGERRYGIYWVTHPEAAGNFVPVGRGDRWRYGLAWDPGAERLDDYSPARWTRLIRLGAGVPDLTPRLGRVEAFEFAALLAERYREGDAFLVGDAAHRVSPRGGTGLNTALADGHDLGWKLAWVLRGWAEAELLDTYQTERRPVGAHIVDRSAQPDGSRATLSKALPSDLGSRIPHHWVRPDVSTLDLLGLGWTVFAAPGARVPDVAGNAPITVHRLDPQTVPCLGLSSVSTVLVHPDGVPLAANGSRGRLIP